MRLAEGNDANRPSEPETENEKLEMHILTHNPT